MNVKETLVVLENTCCIQTVSDDRLYKLERNNSEQNNVFSIKYI